MEKFLQKLEDIASDRKHGAAQLFLKAANVLLEWAEEDGSNERFVTILKAVAQTQPGMAPMLNLVNYTLLAWEKGGIKEVKKTLAEVLHKDENKRKAISEQSLPLILQAERVVTLSFSSSVFDAIKLSLKSKKTKVLVSQGIPLMGGVRIAKMLYDLGAEVYLCTDALLPSLLQEGDIVLVGADAVTPFGLINRCGSYPLALTARDRAVSFYSVTSTEKFLPKELLKYYTIEEKNPDEVLPNVPFFIINRYFDETPLELVTGFVTEKGILSAEKVKELLSQLPVSSLVSKIWYV